MDGVILCSQYVFGVQDTVSMMRVAGFLKPDQVPFCIPAGTTGVQLVATVKKYFTEDPNQIQQGQNVFGSVPVIAALIKGYPCTSKPAQ